MSTPLNSLQQTRHIQLTLLCCLLLTLIGCKKIGPAAPQQPEAVAPATVAPAKRADDSFMLLEATATPPPTPVSTAVPGIPAIIEIANIAGVAGYEIGIFGNGFGNTSGTVIILEQEAEVKDWHDTFVRVVIPDAPDGSSEKGLTVIPSEKGKDPASSPFTVYSIAPEFLTAPTTSYENVSFGKPVRLSGQVPLDGEVNRSQCTKVVTGDQLIPEDYLTNYACNSDVGAKFGADEALGTEAIIAVDFEQSLVAGTYIFQFYSRSDWSAAVPGQCPGTGYPMDYVVEASADGESWGETLVTIEDNLRGNRSHFVEVSAETQYLRMRVTDSVGDCLDYLAGNDFELKEVRLYKVDGDLSETGSAFAIYGDSITAGAFNTFTGAQGLNARIAQRLGLSYPTNLPFSPLGYAGRKAVQLAEEFEDPNEIADAYNDDAIAGSARYWGVALGTNDMTITGVDDPAFTELTSHFNLFDEGIEVDAVQWLIAQGRVPMIARMPDTNEAANGFGFIEAKIKILNDIDRISAEYQLIPGPDFYTEFRLNIERDNGSWISEGDGTHLVEPTHWVDLWADAFTKAVQISAE